MPANGREFAEKAFELIRTNDAHADDFRMWGSEVAPLTDPILPLFTF